jgi:uncharacterized membrane protein YfcA
MAHNDYLPITDETQKKSKKNEIIWTTLITIFLGFWAVVLIFDFDRDLTKGSTIVMLISTGFTFFLILGIMLLKSIKWAEPEKCEKTLHYFYLIILVLSIVGIFSGIIGLSM